MSYPLNTARCRSAALLMYATGLWLIGGIHACAAATFTVGDDGACTHSTVQAAINAATGSGPHLIKIKTAIYPAQAINVSSKEITLTGGFANCSAATPNGVSTLSGAGGANSSVLGITGANNDVILENLAIIRGDEVSDGTGGGIDFRGGGFLTLRRTAVTQNYAGYGGGINVGASGYAEVRIERGSVLLANTAQYSGGGVRLEGNAHLKMIDDDTTIQSNQALGTEPGSGDAEYGYGGGVELIVPATADIGSPGYGAGGAIVNNQARYGGGVSLNGVENTGVAQLRLFTTDPSRPVRIEGNRALQDGGGIYLVPYRDFSDVSDVRVCAQEYRIDGNRAAQGAAIYSGTDSDAIGVAIRGGQVNLGNYFCGGEPLASLGAVACATGVACNTINDNVSENAAQQATQGATILIQEGGLIQANHFEMRRNRGQYALRLIGDNTEADLADCLLVNNETTSNLLRQENDYALNVIRIRRCTIAQNLIEAAQVILSTHKIVMENSIIDQPGKTSLVHSGAREISNVVGSEIFSLADGMEPTLTLAAPRFMDPARGDFHLQAASPAVDYSADTGAPGTDADGVLRGRDLAIAPNRFGAGDLGAYERLDIGNLVLNRGFLQDLRLWDVVRAGVASWTSDGAAGGPGSVLTSYTRSDVSMPPAGTLIGLTQCVHIPGPGRYRLSGFAHGVGGNNIDRDKVSLRWEFRANNGTEACAGSAIREGSVSFPSSATFVAPTSDGFIDVSAGEWTRYSTVAISLAVVEGGFQILATTAGYFDGIVLEPVAPLGDLIFADGFEGP